MIHLLDTITTDDLTWGEYEAQQDALEAGFGEDPEDHYLWVKRPEITHWTLATTRQGEEYVQFYRSQGYLTHLGPLTNRPGYRD